jgi:hypothetical protein
MPEIKKIKIKRIPKKEAGGDEFKNMCFFYSAL